MSKKPFDHIENKIREAAENSEPPFNEHAWSKMELLLDKEEKTKRRFFLWWRMGLPLLLAGLVVSGYLLFSISKADKKIATITTPQTKTTENTGKQNSAATKINHSEKTIIPGNESNGNASSDLAPATGNTQAATALIPGTSGASPDAKDIQKNAVGLSGTTASSNTVSGKKAYLKGLLKKRNITDSKPVADLTTLKQAAGKKKKSSTRAKLTVSSTADYATLEDSTLNIEQQKTRDIAVYGSTSVKDTSNSDAKTDSLFVASMQKKNITDSATLKEQSVAKTAKNKKDKKMGNSSKFYIVAEGGVEILKTKLFSYGNTLLSGRYGVATGYEINKRLNVQAGFYAGRKKYTGGAADYHPKQGTYWSMVNIQQVNASCLVYDIPISLRYNFWKNKAFQWYAMAGISSYIMKKEDYYYYYTYSNMPYAVHEKPYSYTGNKSLFSILNLSAGFERKISDRTSLIAEPYISLPLSGVGDGAVKLYSTGLQIGIKYHPKF